LVNHERGEIHERGKGQWNVVARVFDCPTWPGSLDELGFDHRASTSIRELTSGAMNATEMPPIKLSCVSCTSWFTLMIKFSDEGIFGPGRPGSTSAPGKMN
jgi:hypothetical protein